jgi:hypothetical protein
VQYFTSLGNEHYCEGKFNGDEVENKLLHTEFLDFMKHIFFNEYVEGIWNCTFKFGPSPY